MLLWVPKKNRPSVALRKESVDRNSEDWLNAGSLSVALRKESVDRNLPISTGFSGG